MVTCMFGDLKADVMPPEPAWVCNAVALCTAREYTCQEALGRQGLSVEMARCLQVAPDTFVLLGLVLLVARSL